MLAEKMEVSIWVVCISTGPGRFNWTLQDHLPCMVMKAVPGHRTPHFSGEGVLTCFSSIFKIIPRPFERGYLQRY